MALADLGKIGYPGYTMTRILRFPPPVPARRRRHIQPVFLPFAGCEYRCIFCAQSLQSGTSIRSVQTVLAELAQALEKAAGQGEAPRELAFYGGTFTALPMEAQLDCLRLAARYREQGLISRVRASTRPDKITRANLDILRKNGLDMLELGVQSFDDAVLAANRPGYTGADASAACAVVHESGMTLGVQLMPGMPGMDAAIFRRDMEQTLAARPAALRLYPCLVIEGTALADLWRNGGYTPWDLEDTIALLASALLAAEAQDIAVIRMGLAPEPGLAPNILAGPQHPSLGSRIRGRALYERVRKQCMHVSAGRDKTPSRLTLPRRLRGEFSGHRGELLPLYSALGLDAKSIRWHDDEYCELEFAVNP